MIEMTGQSDKVAHILVITLSNIGDAVMTTPVLESLHREYPHALLDLVTDPRSSALFEHCPYRDRLLHRHKQGGWPATLRLVKQLRQRRYDLVVDLRTDGLAWLLRARRRLTRWGSRHLRGHAVERHMAVIRQCAGITSIPSPRVWPTDGDIHFARQALAGIPGQRWLGIGPGANAAAKRWPVQHFVDLITEVSDRYDAFVLLGNRQDRARCRLIADHLPDRCADLAGRTTLLQAAAVLGQVRLFAGNDSGLGHLAAAMDTPTVTLFGPGEPERYHPWHPEGRWICSRTGDIRDITAREAAEIICAATAPGSATPDLPQGINGV